MHSAVVMAVYDGCLRVRSVDGTGLRIIHFISTLCTSVYELQIDFCLLAALGAAGQRGCCGPQEPLQPLRRQDQQL